jgi:hypothetical protein
LEQLLSIGGVEFGHPQQICPFWFKNIFLAVGET